jgi:hypothetical protein
LVQQNLDEMFVIGCWKSDGWFVGIQIERFVMGCLKSDGWFVEIPMKHFFADCQKLDKTFCQKFDSWFVENKMKANVFVGLLMGFAQKNK